MKDASKDYFEQLAHISLAHCTNPISADEIIRLDYQYQHDHVQRLIDQGFPQDRVDEAKTLVGSTTRKMRWVEKYKGCDFFRYSHWLGRCGSSGLAATRCGVVIDHYVEYFS